MTCVYFSCRFARDGVEAHRQRSRNGVENGLRLCLLSCCVQTLHAFFNGFRVGRELIEDEIQHRIDRWPFETRKPSEKFGDVCTDRSRRTRKEPFNENSRDNRPSRTASIVEQCFAFENVRRTRLRPTVLLFPKPERPLKGHAPTT